VDRYLNDRVQAKSVCAGDYLSQVRHIENEITCKLAHMRCLRDLRPGSLRVNPPSGSGDSDPTGEHALRIEELRQEINALYEDMRKTRSRIARIVARLPNTRTRCLMEMRYLSGLTWEEIAESLSITPRSALRLHQKALRSVDVLLRERDA